MEAAYGGDYGDCQRILWGLRNGERSGGPGLRWGSQWHPEL